jgi:hypothetical protein
MAVVVSAAGAPAAKDGQQQVPGIPRLGATAASATSGASATITLPVGYGAYLVTATKAAWCCWTTASDAASVRGTNCFLIPDNFFDYLAPPANATGLSVIQDAAAGNVCVTGIL